MGTMEDASRKRSKKASIQNLILGSIAITGVLAVALVAPNVVGALQKAGVVPRGRQKEYIRDARRKLMQKGLIIEQDGFLRLSTKGLRYFEQTNNLDIGKPPRKWDRKWRVLIFDIPEKRRIARDTIRHHLQRVGFVRAQNSVWIYPYPCEEFVALLKAECRVGKDVLYLIVDSIENDERFRRAFNISDPNAAFKITGTPGKILDVVLPEKK